ncbi:MAG: LUD domain-containing protein [Rhizobiaceae bacterium]|nr:LUD domain-containing protein [Rhizobiaceae bacterium]MBL4696520.1 LUD domain-containing protein [Rhizobiaceae bacterium]
MSQRDEILGRIRSAIAPNGNDTERRKNLRTHLTSNGVIPKLPKSRAGIQTRFKERAIVADATVEFSKPEAVAKNISKYLRDHNLPAIIKTGDDQRLRKLLKGSDKLLEISRGISDGNDLVGVSHAMGGVAETGTLFMTSGKANPTTLNFLPETHIVVVNENDVEANYEDLLKKLRRKFGVGKMPRVLNMITGPSRSADIEQTLILGAHGPLRLHIIIVRN